MKKIDWKNIDIKKLAGVISSHLKKNNIDAVLVGGACVSIYTKNKYLSYDLDYVTFELLANVEKVLKQLSFKRTGRLFRHKQCSFILDFPAPPVSIGQECPVKDFNYIKTKTGTIKLLTPTDSVKDRLASYFYWSDQQALEQAILIAKNQRINLKKVENWVKHEGEMNKFKKIQKLFVLKDLK